MLPAVDPSVAQQHDVRRVTSDARVWPAFGLSIKLQVLKLITLYVYRFWAETRIRRMLWTSAQLDGDRFEYRGTGGQLFRGGLLATVLLAAMLALVNLAEYLASDFTERKVQILVNLPIALLFLMVVPYYSWRYRTRATTWRGIAFGHTGTFMSFFQALVPTLVISMVTLGILYPKFDLAIRRHLLTNSHFGTQAIAVERGSGLSLVVPYASIYLLFGAALFFLAQGVGSGQHAVVGGAALIGAVFAFGWYRAEVTRLVLSEVRIAGATVTSDLQPWKFGLLALVPGVIAVVTVLVGIIAIGVAPESQKAALLILILIAVVLGFWLYGLISLPLVRVPRTRLLLASITVTGPIDWSAIGQTADWAKTGSATGDGLDLALG
jgi:hypothetical protein